ncbi:MAG: RNA methyltransferase [Gammaproteobacteria bacterium]|nr:RNA methyltransferase [Gammaproteobacteria bacterium]
MPPSKLEAVRVVLVDTSHPGNIGAVARAMWAMGLQRLSLVRPKRFPSADATVRAAGADALLYHADVCDSLEHALADCAWVVGTSVRSRRLELPRLTPRGFAARAVEEVRRGQVALVFGREQTGLSNQELDQCQAVASVATNPDFNSLNLAAAVQVFTYELQLAFCGCARGSAPGSSDNGAGATTAAELEGLYTHLEQALADIGYYDPQSPKLLMRRLRQFYGRARPDRAELNILRGILAASQRAAGKSRGR